MPFKRNRLLCVRCVNENRKKRKRLRWQAANHGCHCFDRAFLLAGACVCCVKAIAFLAVFIYATHATQANAFEWKPGFSCISIGNRDTGSWIYRGYATAEKAADSEYVKEILTQYEGPVEEFRDESNPGTLVDKPSEYNVDLVVALCAEHGETATVVHALVGRLVPRDLWIARERHEARLRLTMMKNSRSVVPARLPTVRRCRTTTRDSI